MAVHNVKIILPGCWAVDSYHTIVMAEMYDKFYGDDHGSTAQKNNFNI